MKRHLRRLGAADGGATAIEYGLIAGAVALALLTAYWTLGESLRAGFAEITEAISLEKDEPGGRGILFGTRPEPD